ncbi:MAG TPA: CHAT domain-containing protein [Myxococcaceae bacterium]|nr:CHAT domain-containing protein [Myxococcaceae bacterium]
MNPRTVSLLAAVLGGCAPRCGGPTPPPPAVEYAGCLAVVRGPTCELKPDRELRVLAAVPAGSRLVILADGKELDASGGNGLRTLHLPPGAAAVDVVLVDAGGRRSAPWRLAVRNPGRAPVLVQAMELVPKGGIADAAKLLAERRADLAEEDRARADSMIARASLATGHREEGIAQLAASAAAHERLGHAAEATRDTLAQAFTLVDLWRFEEARAALAAADRRTRDYDEGRAQAAYYRGLLSRESGDLRSALRQLEEAAAGAERLGMTLDREAAVMALAVALRQLGRPGAALERLKELHPGDPCNAGTLANNTAWAMLAAGDDSLGDPVPHLERALAIFRAGCPRAPEVANQLLNLALAELRRGDLDAAAARLKEARGEGGPPEPRSVLWWLDVEARIALGRGKSAEALGLYRRLEALAAAAGSGEGRWRAAVGKAEALAARGDASGALRAHEEADRLLDAEALLVPLTEGREHFLADRERGARHHVMLLISQGRTSEAMLVARRTRARFLQAVGLGQRLSALGPAERTAWDRALSSYRRGRADFEAAAAQDWALAEDQLREAAEQRQARAVALRRALDDALAALGATAAPSPAMRAPEPGELLLMWFPATDRWYGFAATAGKAVAHALPAAPDLKDGGAALLQPFDREVEAAARVTVIPYGALRGADLHAATWRGAPLAASKPVAYAVDLPAAKAAAPANAGGGSLVVGDPLRNLPEARREAEAVHAALIAGGQPSTLQLGDQATRSALRQALGSVRLLHYAGHGRFGGEGGWDSALPLADGELNAGDILTLQAPPAVVLAGCETGRAAEGSLESIGLAQAFVLAGARAVIAASRPVDDRTTARLSEALYAPGGPPGPSVLPERLRQAQQKLRDEGADWSAFRALVQ